MLNLRLYMLQRITALLMAPFVLIHLGVMIYAIQGGLNAGEILSRTQGSIAWFLFYGLFVVALSIIVARGFPMILARTPLAFSIAATKGPDSGAMPSSRVMTASSLVATNSTPARMCRNPMSNFS